MVLGLLRACQKVIQNGTLSFINPFKGCFFQTKKKYFFPKFRVEKLHKYFILSCGFKKRFWGV